MGLRCKDVRLELQAPEESAYGLQTLEEHVQECASCRQYAEQQRSMDAAIVRTLAAVSDGVPIRRPLRTPLPDGSQAAVRRRRMGGRLMALGAPIALAAAILAALLPHSTSDQRNGESSAQVYTPVRPSIAYPLTVDAARPGHLLAGAWGRVYESWNGGETWKPLAPFPGSYIIRDLVIDRTEPKRYLVASNRSILVSIDAGRHWRVTAGALPGALNMFLLQDARDPGTFFVGPSVLWKSVDHGATWAPAGPGHIFAPDGIQALTVLPDGSLYTAIWNGGVAVSHDGGRSWQRRSVGLTPKVFDVTSGDGGLWAVGPSGVFSSHNGGIRWKRTSPNDRFIVTGVLARSGYVLAGGNGAIYRSVDGGRQWVLGMDGLPPAPYVYGLIPDPRKPDRVYASLNSDGIFRSDDGGQTWTAMNTGLPLANVEGDAPRILFLRRGVLWYTSSTGSDPGNLTVDETVQLGALSSDGGSVAYLAGTDANWAVRLVSSGGSGARTVMHDSGDIPRRLLWSPDTTRLAAVGTHTVYVSPLSGLPRMWTLRTGDRIEGWTRDGKSLIVWQRSTHRLTPLTWDAGIASGRASRVYPTMPHRSPDGTRLALIYRHTVEVGRMGGTLRALRSVEPTCRIGSWSFDNSRLLVLCSGYVEILSGTGDIRRVAIHGAITWLPGSNSQLLVFQKGDMVVWNAGHVKRLVRNAWPASGTS